MEDEIKKGRNEKKEKMTWKVEVTKVAHGFVNKIDDTFVYFDGDKGRLIIPKKLIEEIK